MSKIRITQIKSTIKKPKDQKLTMTALGLNKIGKSKEMEASEPVLGMVRKVSHLLKVENI